MKTTQKNLEFNMNVTMSKGLVVGLTLCNVGAAKISVSDDSILLNDMYAQYPFFFSGDLDSKCEPDSSGYQTGKILMLPKECLHNTWSVDRDCNFKDIAQGNYTVRFEQVIQYYEDNNSESITLGDSANFIV